MTSNDSAGSQRFRLQFTRTHVIVLGILGSALIVFLVFSWLTRDAMAELPFLRGKQEASKNTLVDIRPWQTAQQLSSLAVTAEEEQLAHEAEHLADHDVQDAFNAAIRQAQFAAGRHPRTGEALQLSQKVDQLEKQIKDDQAAVQAMTSAAGPNAANANSPDNDDVELAKAQLTLDSDELADAQLDLARVTGDKRGQIQQELNDYQAAVKKYDAQTASKGNASFASNHNYGRLAARIRAWFNQRNRQQLLLVAAQQSDADAKAVTALHDRLEKQPARTPATAQDRGSRLAAIRDRSLRNQLLTIYDDQIQTNQQLQSLYKRWADQVQMQHQIVAHLIVNALAALAAVLILAILLDELIRSILRRTLKDRQMYSYRIMARLLLWVVATAAILVIVFGLPNEMPTIVGLTTAGLTVVLQDFIISFCGWFVLIGKNGIRKGDWVEINGVGGEVSDVSVFRTTLLETGNWTDHGHPTGRRITFPNSFAIKGQYFNFTTGGQWMWDEITISVSNSDDAYSNVELIHKVVLEETQAEALLAEEEWERLGLDQGLARFSANAAVNMRPSASGIDIVVRYVTRASTRYMVRNRIFLRVIELLHRPAALMLPAPFKKDESGTIPPSSG